MQDSTYSRLVLDPKCMLPNKIVNDSTIYSDAIDAIYAALEMKHSFKEDVVLKTLLDIVSLNLSDN